MHQKWITYQWSLAHALVMLFLTGFSLLVEQLYLFGLVACISFLCYIFMNRNIFIVIQPFAGYANWVTFFRMGLLLHVCFCYKDLSYFTICSFLIFNILLDIADGIIARKFKAESAFGKYLDMELDAFYVCLAALILCFEGLVGPWIIVIGVLRYIYSFVIVLLNVALISEPKQKFASLAAGSLFWFLLLPFYNTQFNFLLMLVSLLVVFSFIKSFVFQMKRRN